jgi:type IV pilus assembly protein PilY1
VRAGALPKDWFFDGTLTHHVIRDARGSVTRVFLFATVRRGGALLYAFDVTDPASPKFLWRHARGDGSDPAFDDLALTFSAAKPARVAGHAQPVVVFGGGYPGGYDSSGAPLGEDAEPAPACVAGPQAGCGNRIFVLDAATGAVVKTFQRNAGQGGDLARSVAADLALVDSASSGVIDRAYAADTGGGIWRIDFDARGPAQWKLYKLAQAGSAAAPRKFLHAPDAVVTKRYTAVLAGSGDREKPLKTTGSDRFYMIKDRVTTATVQSDATGAADRWPIDADSTGYDNMADVAHAADDDARRTLASPLNNGWFYALGPAERVVNAPLTAAGIVYFGTQQPSSASSNACTARLGIARAYGLAFNSGRPGRDADGDGTIDRADAAVVLAGGGFPASPAGGLVTLRDAASGRDVTIPFLFGAGGAAGGTAGLASQAAPARIVQKLPKSIRKTYWYRRPLP